MSLYEECKQRKALPHPGGLMDQSAELMGWFSTIDRVINEFKQKQSELKEREWQTSRQT